MLSVNSFSSFSFPDYNNCRKVVVNGNEYDLDNEFCHNNSKATEIISAIDNMMSDLGEDTETILKKTEISITDKSTKRLT